ncbi:Hsp20/alpha crystallin family protein [Steroidobacter sp. S1-65]|uniref:Hsp20/alpha crystallin family protein n=1 Tax=Steroidobacter gossypii TaxID=2805490 RepID=A0ABS1X1B4_9GAMM|nr:Hsp20/alpha crystallin family protein [Steroidobacter gossypii]MBM0106994.1 Hsp20/alpha crystallin family protein [Steroidobacter gossypii]
MSVRDLIPWRRGNDQTPAMFRDDDRNPFLSLHREMNRLFDDAFRGFDTRWPSFGSAFASERSGWPSLEIAETDEEWKVCAEIPGMEEKDIELLMDDGSLTLRGEKRSEIEDKEKQFSERYYGRFERRIPLAPDVQADRAEARFKNGVLTITIPKSPNSKPRVKRIPIKN